MTPFAHWLIHFRAASHFFAGLGSGLVSSVILQPIDLLKTRAQQSGRGSIASIVREITQQSRLGLWRGTVPSALRTGFGSAIYFTSLNSIRQHAAQVPAFSTSTAKRPPNSLETQRSSAYSSSLPRLSNSGNLLAGAVARAFAGFVLMPLTIIKVRYESSLYSYSSLLGAGGEIYRKEGVRGFFTGFGATAMRDAPYAGLYVLFYEQFKTQLSSIYSGESAVSNLRSGSTSMSSPASAGVNFSSGLLAATLCTLVSNPFDAVKTRLQLQPNVYHNMYHTGVKMVTEEGIRSLWGGLALRLARKALSSAIAWTLYEELIRKTGNWRVARKGGEHNLS